MRLMTLLAGLAVALLAAAAPSRAQTAADMSPRTGRLVNNGSALEDVDKRVPFSQREINKRQHRPPDPYILPKPNLRPSPPLTLDVAPIPLPDPRPRALFSNDFPGLKFEREEEYGFKFSERGG